jgi:hypothetical protein
MPIDLTTNHSAISNAGFASASSPAGSPLDSLLSPRGSKFDDHASSAEAVAGSELGEVGLDDESDFSMVPLSARQSTVSIGSNTSIKSIATQLGKDSRRRTTILSTTPLELSSLTNSLHKKSASVSSERSMMGNSTPFILARLESQKGQEEYGPISHRASVDGQQKLQEEFVRVQNEIREEGQEDDDNTAHTGIDWGVCCSILSSNLRNLLVLSRILGSCYIWWAFNFVFQRHSSSEVYCVTDYQQFACENPERLAKAIERGIPGTLRGMMWYATLCF